MKLYGLMITKDDEAIFKEWCDDQLHFYDAVLCLDGSETTETEEIASNYSNILYQHERNCNIPHKTDHGLRSIVHKEIVRQFGHDNWIMCCHADEFCYHDPRKIVDKAVRLKYDAVRWYSLHFYPHPDDLIDWDERQHYPVQERFTHYHWNRKGGGFPHLEARMYRNTRRVYWDDHTHASTQPHGIRHIAPFHPILKHYKVFTTDLAEYELDGTNTRYRTHWLGNRNRTGLPFTVQTERDLFVDSIPNYHSCSKFEGTIPHRWNIGEQYRPTLLQGGSNGSKTRNPR